MPPPQRRIEDRIRELCAKAAINTDDLEPALQELSQLLRETIKHMRLSATKLLVEGKPLSEPRRRANDGEQTITTTKPNHPANLADASGGKKHPENELPIAPPGAHGRAEQNPQKQRA